MVTLFLEQIKKYAVLYSFPVIAPVPIVDIGKVNDWTIFRLVATSSV